MKALSSCGHFGITKFNVLIMHICLWVLWASISFGPFAHFGDLEALDLKIQGNKFLIVRNIKLFGYSVILNFFLRIVMYIICGAVMKGFVPSYINIT